MRTILPLLTLLILISCGVSTDSDKNSGNDENNISGGSIQFKNLNGDFDKIKQSDVLNLKVAVTDSTGGTTLEKSFLGSEILERIGDLGLASPGQAKISKPVVTGKVTVIFVDSNNLSVTKVFTIYNNKYLQDVFFSDVLYNTKKPLTFEWLSE